MKDDTQLGDRVHPAALMYAEEVAAGKLSRREFLTRSSALGVSAVAAYGLLGLAAPQARAQDATPGGTLRMRSSSTCGWKSSKRATRACAAEDSMPTDFVRSRRMYRQLQQ